MSKPNITPAKKWIIAILVIVFLFIIGYLPSRKFTINSSNIATSTLASSSTIAQALSQPVTDTSESFNSLKLQARAVYVLDITTNKVIYEKNANVALPLASIAKLMTALLASEILKDETQVIVSTSSLALEGSNNLIANEAWRFKDLRDFTLLVSSNDGANAIALAAASSTISFVSEMNDKAATLNLSTLHFNNESGLDINQTTPGAIGSAKEVSQLMHYILMNRPDILSVTRHHTFKFTSLDGINHTGINTDRDITRLSGIIASKTGYTLLAGGNLTIVYSPSLNHPIIITVLGSTADGRFSDTLKLASSTRAYLIRQ